MLKVFLEAPFLHYHLTGGIFVKHIELALLTNFPENN